MKLREEMIPLFKVFMTDEAASEASRVLKSGFIGQGPEVNKFEDILSEYFGTDNVVTTNSATSAEHLAIHMLKRPEKNVVAHHGVSFEDRNWPGIVPGDEILTTPLTCTATNWPILTNGIDLKWVDVDPILVIWTWMILKER